ncbi:MAG: IS110 family transposase [Pseudomonadota bacterium]
MNITTLGIDLAKNVFQLHGADQAGKAVLKKTVTRAKLPSIVAQLPACTVVMEACGGANFWARQFTANGHQVKLISPQFVKPFVKGNKNDACDAEAIVEAASRPAMRYVSPKTIEQQDMQSLLRIRESCIAMRIKLSNQLRGLLAEYGIVFDKGINRLRSALPSLFDREKENELTEAFKQLLEMQYQLLISIDEQLSGLDMKLVVLAKTNETCQRVQQVEGIGPITAVALTATVGNPNDFKNGRHFSAFLGLVPKQNSSGGHDRLLGISKRGDSYLRQLFIHGARAVLLRSGKKLDARSRWINGLKERRGMNRATVALANKNARIALALLLNKEDYKKAV